MSENISINGVEVGELLEFKNLCAQHPEKADRNPALVAQRNAGYVVSARRPNGILARVLHFEQWI